MSAGKNISIFTDLRNITFEFCYLLNKEWSLLYLTKCITGSTLGVFSAYIFPIFAIIALITNSVFIYVFFKKRSSMPRHMIYMLCVLISSGLTDFIVGWLWLFPSRGLPYATKGKIYFSLISLSSASCKLYRLLHSFTSTSIVNLLVLSAVDRCLAIKAPIKFSKVQSHHAWWACGIIYAVSFLMMLPFGILVTWNRKKDEHFCWIRQPDKVLHIYHTLFSNFGPIQTVILLFLNLTFLLCTRKYLRNRFLQQCTNNTRTMSRREMRICLLNLILSSCYIAISLPQAICLLLARIPLPSMTAIHSGIAYDIAHLMWSLNSVREIVDFIIYAIYFKPLTELLLQCYLNITFLFYRRLKRLTTFTTTNTTDNNNNDNNNNK
uniref:G_PROTEIN_RECEP_F1_2 domain-containing protein n=1 Tax=Schistosoma mansoni TaxID=6183 RepID=A0A3Q0KV61_SCHMA